MSLPSLRRRARWAALLAAALNALTPLAASGGHGADGLSPEICSVNAPVADGGAPPAAPDGAATHPGHCALCSASGAKFAALPAAAAAPGEAPAAAERSPLPADAAQASTPPYLRARPRAPPAPLV